MIYNNMINIIIIMCTKLYYNLSNVFSMRNMITEGSKSLLKRNRTPITIFTKQKIKCDIYKIFL